LLAVCRLDARVGGLKVGSGNATVDQRILHLSHRSVGETQGLVDGGRSGPDGEVGA
jgi:hypothetical protein